MRYNAWNMVWKPPALQNYGLAPCELSSARMDYLPPDAQFARTLKKIKTKPYISRMALVAIIRQIKWRSR